jgi:hypothetical protein
MVGGTYHDNYWQGTAIQFYTRYPCSNAHFSAWNFEKIYDYLGMTLDLAPLEMYASQWYMDGVVATATPSHLFEVNITDPIMLDKDNATLFHHNVAKLLFLCKSIR